jgi:DNA-binding HxlR family transcriptional regulator
MRLLPLIFMQRTKQGDLQMERYGQFCPIAKALELVGSRWTPLVLRELLAGGRLFSDIQQGVPLMSRSLLAQRLKELESAGLLQATEKKIGRGHEYSLTEAGKAAESVIAALGDWGARYAQPNIGPEDCDPYMMFRAVRRHGNLAALPARRFVIRFELRNLPKSRSSLTTWWLVWDRGELDACLHNPGFEIDLVVNVKVDILVRVWMGNIGLTEARARGDIRFEGSAAAERVFVRMLDLRSAPCGKTFNYGPPLAA